MMVADFSVSMDPLITTDLTVESQKTATLVY